MTNNRGTLQFLSYQKILVVVAISIFYLNVPLYLLAIHVWNDLEGPKHWVMLFCLLSLPLLVKQVPAWNALKSPVTVWCLGYAVLTVLWFLFSSQSEMGWQEVRWRFLAILEILVFLMVFGNPSMIILARKTLVGAVLFAVAVNIYELFVPMSFSHVLGRSSGLFLDPNIAGEALVLGMILSVGVLERRYRVPFILLAGSGIFLTLSRAGVLTWVIAVMGLALLRIVRVKDLAVSGSVGLLLLALVLLPWWDQFLTTWDRTGVLNVNVEERLAFFADPSSASDHSSWQRLYVAKQAWNKIADHPLLGNGTGSFHQAATLPHNQYLALMMDHGIMGAVILPLLLAAIALGARRESRRVAIVFAAAVLVLAFFTHSILYREDILILFSLMAAMAATSRAEIARPVAARISERSVAQQAVPHRSLEGQAGIERAPETA